MSHHPSEILQNHTEIWLIRHAETTLNEKGILQGHYDAGLSERGKEQAMRLAKRLAFNPPTLIYSSDLSRALDTARVVADKCGLSIQTDIRLREIDMGNWSNQSIKEIVSKYPSEWNRSTNGDPDYRHGGGETITEVQDRMVQALNEILTIHVGSTVAIISHGIAIRTYLSFFLNLSLPDAYSRITILPTSITCIKVPKDNSIGRLFLLNDVCHLAQAHGFY